MRKTDKTTLQGAASKPLRTRNKGFDWPPMPKGYPILTDAGIVFRGEGTTMFFDPDITY